ncbi:MAG: hypothetical protein AAF805_01140 [Planctomycetota bacterium]
MSDSNPQPGDPVCVVVAKAAAEHLRGVLAGWERIVVERNYAEYDAQSPGDGLEFPDDANRDHTLVDVVAHTLEQEVELIARNKLRLRVPLDVCVRHKFSEREIVRETGRIQLAEIDRYAALTQRVAVAFAPVRLPTLDESGVDWAVWDGEAGGVRPVANPIRAHLRELRQWTSIVRVHLAATVATDAPILAGFGGEQLREAA